MKNTIKYVAYCIADRIDLDRFKQQFSENLVSKGSNELYYQYSDSKYLFLLSYGTVVFSGWEKSAIEERIRDILRFVNHQKDHFSEDDLNVQISNISEHLELSFDNLTVGRFDHAVNKMIMMHLAQSVTLDHFNGLSQGILREIKIYTHEMQINGKIKLGQKKLLRFIGNTLNTKNNIAENLYILDSPEIAWEDEYLDKLHTTLVRHFELIQRYREIDNTLKIIEDNLSIYLSYNHHRESSRLEWVIIILIVIEVVDTFWSKVW